MIEVGVPFENPVVYVPIGADAEKPKKPTMGNVVLKIDCSRIGESSIDYLVRTLKKFLNVQIIGGDLIYAEGNISGKNYGEIWRTISVFNVTVLD